MALAAVALAAWVTFTLAILTEAWRWRIVKRLAALAAGLVLVGLWLLGAWMLHRGEGWDA